MKCLKLIACFLFTLSACKKENKLPTLSFSSEEKNWFIYQVGQSIKFKNALGDSVTYSVSSVRDDFKKEYKDPFNNSVEIGTTEFYQVDLGGPIDSIFIYFYKEFQYSANPDKMQQTIRWNNVLGQFVELEAIKTQAPFTTKTINGITYNRVTQANPISQTLYPWTKWKSAIYDQLYGFIELIDVNDVSWLRQ